MTMRCHPAPRNEQELPRVANKGQNVPPYCLLSNNKNNIKQNSTFPKVTCLLAMHYSVCENEDRLHQMLSRKPPNRVSRADSAVSGR
jgi:hypothetical protein